MSEVRTIGHCRTGRRLWLRHFRRPSHVVIMFWRLSTNKLAIRNSTYSRSALRVQCSSGVGQYSGVLVSPLFRVLLIRCESSPQVSFNAIFVVCIFITSVLQSLDSSQPLDPGSTSQTSKTQLSGLSLVYRILSKKLSGVRSRDAENLDPLPVHQSNNHSRQCGY